jgi:transposase-like protein
VVLCVRWYLSFKLSYRDLMAMMGERGIDLAHTTILRWVQHYAPEFEKRWKRYARPVGGILHALKSVDTCQAQSRAFVQSRAYPDSV